MTDKPALRDRAREELRNYAIIAGYLFVYFSILMFYESTITDGAAASAFRLGTAAVKALIIGKFILLGEAVGVGSTSRAPHLLGAIFTKSLQFLLLLMVLTVVEELLVGKYHGHAFAQTLAEFEQKSMLQVLAKSLLGLLILLPFIATRELSKTLGPGVLSSALMGRRRD